MNVVLLAALALGANATGAQPASAGHANAGAAYCDECGGECQGCGSKHGDGSRRGTPQSCYDPSFGCYRGSRFMHRYPAFHGYYAREAYNYRHYFDYPWHAGLHEPTSMFSYHVPGEAAAENVPPAPVPASARREPTPAVRSAQHLAPIVAPAATRRR